MQINEEIVTKFMAGDIDSFQKIYEITKKSIYGVIYRMIGNYDDAMDIMHDVYVRVYEKRALYHQEKAMLYTWIYKIAINSTLNMLKKKKNWDSDHAIEEIGALDFLDSIDESDTIALVLEVLENINPNYKACLVLRDIEDKTYEEIGDILNLTPGTVRSRIFRGRAELKALFFQYEERRVMV